MKKIFTILLIVLTFTQGYSQKTELKIGLNMGLFSFTGNAATSYTQIYSAPPASASVPLVNTNTSI